jgi:hypothetical protein
MFVPHSLFQLFSSYWVVLPFLCVDDVVVAIGWDALIVAGFECDVLGDEGLGTLRDNIVTNI